MGTWHSECIWRACVEGYFDFPCCQNWTGRNWSGSFWAQFWACIALLASRISWAVVWTHLKQRIMAVQRKHSMHSDVFIKWILTYKCSHSLKMDIQACFYLQKGHTVPAFVLLLSWESKGTTRLADLICSLAIKNWLFGDFFPLVLYYKISDKFCSKTDWGFLAPLFDWEMFLKAWEHNHCMLDMSASLKHCLGQSLAQHRIRGR